MPYQRGLVSYQSSRLRYSNRAVSNSNKAVTVIREAVNIASYESYKNEQNKGQHYLTMAA